VTVGVGRGVSLGGADDAATGLGSTDGDGDAVVLEPPQAARASTASKTSSARRPTTIVDDPRFP